MASLSGDEFKTALKSLGIRQKWLAEELGVALSTVSNWARGKHDVPKYAAAYLGLLAQIKASETADRR